QIQTVPERSEEDAEGKRPTGQRRQHEGVISSESPEIVHDVRYFAEDIERHVPGRVQHVLVPDTPFVEQPAPRFEKDIVAKAGIPRWKGNDWEDIRGLELIVDAGEPLHGATKDGHPQRRWRRVGLLPAQDDLRLDEVPLLVPA